MLSGIVSKALRRIMRRIVELLDDIYHMQILEGDAIRTVRRSIEHIGHFHAGGNRGRPRSTAPKS